MLDKERASKNGMIRNENTMELIKKTNLIAVLGLFIQHTHSVDRTIVYEAEYDLQHRIGALSEDGWSASTTRDQTGFLSYGPYARDWGEGGGQAIFRLMIDDNQADNADVVLIDIFDPAYGEVVASRYLSRRDFVEPFAYQNFSLWFSTQGRNDHDLEARVYWFDRAYIKLDKITIEMDYHQEGLPEIVNQSQTDDAEVELLVRKAIDGLGFDSDKYDAPNQRDLIFVGQYYMAWIDQTGFFGKMNGLWILNGATDSTLDFIHYDEGRVVNFLAVAERGDGQWLTGYQGAEHFEVPHTTAEVGEDTSCEGYLCNWYGLNEADSVSNPKLPHWTVCGDNSISWTKHITPIVQENRIWSFQTIYEGPLTKEGDGDGKHDGDYCHQDYLFEDGIRRPVYLQVGYEFHGDKNYFDRTYQFRNPKDNPVFGGNAWSLIGGLVITQYPESHPLKEDLFNYIKPEEQDLYHGGKLFPAQQWTYYNRWLHDEKDMRRGKDDAWAWLRQPISWAREGMSSLGHSLNLSLVGEVDNNDVGFCFCNNHQGIEVGGGVLHRYPSLLIDEDATSPMAIRRFTFPNHEPLVVFPVKYEAESDLYHQIGRVDGIGWSANTREHRRGHLIYGPYSDRWGEGLRTARFRMMVDNVTDGGQVASIDVYDYSSDEVLASKEIRRSVFFTPFEYQNIDLDFDLAGRFGHKIEVRVWWTDRSYVNVDYVEIHER